MPSFHAPGLSLSERASVSNEPLAKYRLLSVLSWFLRQMLGVLNFCGSKWFSSIFKESSRKIWKWRRLIYILPRQSDSYYHLCTSSMLCVILSTHSRHRIYFIYIWSNILMLFHMGMCMRLKITLHHNHSFTHEFDDYLLSSFYEPSPCNHCGTGRPSTRCTQSPSLRTLNCSLWSLQDLERGCSPFSAWANLCSSSLPFTLRDNSVLLIVRPSG